MERILTVSIPEAWDGKSVRNYLRHGLSLSAGLIQRAKRIDCGISLNGVPVFVTAIVHKGDLFSVVIEADSAHSERIVPAQGALDILFEDEDLLIANKQAGVPVHPSPGHHSDSLGSAVLWYYQKLGQHFVFRPVNRLDKGTSGVMVIAKNALVQERLKREMHTGNFRREYLAIVRGVPIPAEGTIDKPIGRKDGSVLLREVRSDGATAVTQYQTMRETEKFTLLRLNLETGRTHQIRVHMASLGYPILGDFLYGVEEKELISRPALHSAVLELIHPMTGERLRLEAPMPPDMADLIK